MILKMPARQAPFGSDEITGDLIVAEALWRIAPASANHLATKR
jgi:hypothetical protein